MSTRIKLALAALALIAVLLWLGRSELGTSPEADPKSHPSNSGLAGLPAHFMHSRSSPEAATTSNHFREFLKDQELTHLTAEQVRRYLEANHRNAESLLGAFRATTDPSFLKEAMEKYPNDPKVAYSALFLGKLSDADYRQWADTFKRDAPGNPMADYASAMNYFKSGQTDLALQDMMAGTGKAKWDDYSAAFMQSAGEAYQAAGFSAVDSMAAAQSDLLLPDLGQIKQLGVKLGELATSDQQAGDTAAAQNALQMDVRLGQQLSATDTQPLITSLVGYAIERMALAQMDPGATFGSDGQTVQDQLDQIQQQKLDIRSLVKQYDGLWQQMSDEDMLTYLQRRQMFGEINAIQWAANKYAQP